MGCRAISSLIAIALVMVLSHYHLVRRGIAFDDPSWCFHFGRRIVDGAAPYRDFVFQGGPLPLYVDAAFQSMFGSSYTASLYAALTIATLRVLAVWLIVRRLAGASAAALLAVWCGLDPVFAVHYHTAASYTPLLVVLAGLFLLLASQHGGAPAGPPGAPPADRQRDRRPTIYLALAGASTGLVVAARPGAAAALAIVALIATAILHVRGEIFTRARLLAFWAGFAGAIVVVFTLLAIAGVLGPALQQMFLDAPAKKGLRGIAAVLDAISGGGLVDPWRSWWGGFLLWVGLSVAIVAAATCLAALDRRVPSATVAIVALAALVLVGLFQRYALLGWLTDLPRMFLTAITVLALGAPARMRRWFGVEPVVAIGLGTLPLASDWALQASLPGRNASDVPSLVTGALLVTLASRQLAPRAKTVLCGALALAAVVHATVALRGGSHPFADADVADGPLRDNKFTVRNPVLRGLRVHDAKRKAIGWLTSQVPPGSTCFVYGNAPVLYDLLGCRNPTRVDTTAAGALTTADAEQALATLRQQPPELLIAHDKTAMVPALTVALDDRLDSYGAFNPEPLRALHVGLRALLDHYEPVGVVGEILAAPVAAKADALPDHINAIRLYRRKR